MQLSSFFKLKRRFRLKPYLLIVAAILVVQSASAQKIGKPLVDSLLTRLSLVKADTERCSVYQHLSFAYLHRDPNAAYDYAIKAKTLAEKIHSKKGMASALNALGLIYNGRTDYTNAISCFNKALQLAIEIQYKNGQATIYNNLALCYRNQNKHDQDIEFSKKAINIYLAINGRVDNLYNNLCYLTANYRQKKQTNEATKYLTDLLQRTNSANPYLNNLYKVYINAALAYSYVLQKKNTETQKYLEAADQFAKASGNFKAQGFIFTEISFHYLDLKDTTRFLQYQQKAIDLYTEKQYLKGVAEAYGYIGTRLTDKQQNLAISYFKKAADIFHSLEDDGESIAYTSLARLYELHNQESLMLTNAAKAIDASKRDENKVILIDRYSTLGNFLYEKKRYPEAFNNFNIALDLAQKLHLDREYAYQLSYIASAYRKLRDYTNTLVYLKREIAIGNRLNDHDVKRDAFASTANVYYITHDYSSAIKYANELLKMDAGSYFIPDDEDLLASYNSGAENWQEAFIHYEKMYQANKELGNFPAWESLALTGMAEASYHFKEYGKAMDYIQQAKKIGEYEGQAFLTLGMIVRDAPESVLSKYGIDAKDRYNKSLEYLKYGYEHIEKNVDYDLDNKTNYWHQLNLTYEKQKDEPNAYATYKKYIAYRDSVSDESDAVNFKQKEQQFNFSR